jgi:glucokinase
MAATLDLQRISMGGSVFWHHREFLLPKLQSHWQGKFAALTDGLAVVPAGLGLQVGDYAALALVLDAKT